MLRAVIFDIDGTLYDYDAAHRAAFAALTAYAGEALGLAPERFEALHREAGRALEARLGRRCAAVHNRLIRCQLILELAGRPIARAPEMASLYWSALFDAMRPCPGVGTAFERIRAMGLSIGIGTNMTADHQYTKLGRLGLLDRVDFMVTSEEAGVEKPDARLFELCALKAGCPAAACAFVGDSLQSDVLGAVRAGMRAVWFHPQSGPIEAVSGALSIRSMAQLPGLLASIQTGGV